MSVAQKAWSTFLVKSVDDDRRILTGIASTPSTDRMGDIVEPLGAEFELPLPFLWQHDMKQPVGHVISAKPNKSGIPVEIQMAQTNEPGTLKDRLDEAWQSIKLGLVRGLSIGFAPIEYSILDSGGLHFKRWNWFELSGVTVPANADGAITSIKRIDLATRAAPTVIRKFHPLDLIAGDGADISDEEMVSYITAQHKALVSGIGPFMAAKDFTTAIAKLTAYVTMHQADSVYAANANAQLRRRIEGLERSLAERKYFGVWERGQYREHNQVTKGGNLWIALCDTDAVPGEHDSWQLAVRRGRDAR